jgi:hypothetical protein
VINAADSSRISYAFPARRLFYTISGSLDIVPLPQGLTRRDFGESSMTQTHDLCRYALLLFGIMACSASEQRSAASPQCDQGDGGITLPRGFCTSVFADEVGVARPGRVMT